MHEPLHQISMWRDTFKGDSNPITGASTIMQVDTMLDNKVKMHEFAVLAF